MVADGRDGIARIICSFIIGSELAIANPLPTSTAHPAYPKATTAWGHVSLTLHLAHIRASITGVPRFIWLSSIIYRISHLIRYHNNIWCTAYAHNAYYCELILFHFLPISSAIANYYSRHACAWVFACSRRISIKNKEREKGECVYITLENMYS